MLRNENLLRTLNSCMLNCDRVAAEIIDVEDFKAVKECLGLSKLCASICKTTAVAVLHPTNYPLYKLLCECYEICIKCAHECDKINVTYSQTCRRSCLACADVCKQNAPLFLV